MPACLLPCEGVIAEAVSSGRLLRERPVWRPVWRLVSDEGIGSVRGHKHIWNERKKIDARSARGQMKGKSALVKCVHVFFFSRTGDGV